MEKSLFAMTPEEVEKAWDNSLLSDEDVMYYTTAKKYAEGGLHKLDDMEVEFLWDSGVIEDRDVEKYVDRRDSPVMYQIKDILFGAYAGPRNALTEMSDAVNALGDWLSQFNTEKGPYRDAAVAERETLRAEQQKARDAERDNPDTVAGALVAGTMQFLTGFIPGLKVASAMKAVPALAKLATTAPKTWTFMRSMTAGAGADLMVFDPHDARFADFIAELGIENPVIDWLKADPSDSELTGRFKNVLEGAGLGAAFEGLFQLLRVGKSVLWKKNGNLIDRVAADVDRLSTAQKTEGVGKGRMEIVDPGANVKAVSDELDPVLEDLGQKRMGLRETAPNLPPARSAEMLAQADDFIKLTKGEIQGTGIPYPKRPNLKYFEGVDDAIALMRIVGEKIPEPVTRGFKVVEQLSRNVGGDALTMEDNIRNLFGQVQNMDSMMKAVNDYLITYSDAIADMAKKATSVEDTIRVASHIQHYSDLMFKVSGAKTEVARALNANKIVAHARRFEWEKVPKGELQKAIRKGDARKLQKAVKQFADLDKVHSRGQYARNFGRSRFANMLVEFRQSALVSDTATQVVNILGNAGALTLTTAERTIALLGHGMAGDPVRFRQAIQLYTSLYRGFLDGFGVSLKARPIKSMKAFLKGDNKLAAELADMEGQGKVWQALIKGEPITDALTKYDQGTGAIPGEFGKMFASGVKWYERIPLGDIIRLPFRALSTADEAFKSISYAQRKYYHTFDKALDQTRAASGGKFNKDLFKKNFNYLLTEDPEMHLKGLQGAREATFTTPMYGMAKKVGDVLNHPNGLPIKILFVPFYNILSNIVKFSMQRTPLGVLGKKFREDFIAGGVSRSEALVRIATGTALLGAGVTMYQSGRYVGSAPEDQRHAWRNAGIQEYSFITEDGRSIKVSRLDPGSFWLGLGADLARMYEEYQLSDGDLEKVITMGLLAVTHNISDKAFMSGIKEMYDVITGEQNLEKWAQRTASSFTPFAIRQQRIQRENDEYMREVYSFMDALIKGSPHWLVDASEKLAPRRHAIYGTPIKNIDRVGKIFPVTDFSKHEDRAVLDMFVVGANVRPMGDKIQFGSSGEEIKLEGRERDQYIAMLERFPVQDVLNRVHDAIKGIQDDRTRANIYMSVVNEFRGGARALYLAEIINNQPERVQEIMAKVEERALAVAGVNTVKDESTRTYQLDRILHHK
jgi:hypothetical protein